MSSRVVIVFTATMSLSPESYILATYYSWKPTRVDPKFSSTLPERGRGKPHNTTCTTANGIPRNMLEGHFRGRVEDVSVVDPSTQRSGQSWEARNAPLGFGGNARNSKFEPTGTAASSVSLSPTSAQPSLSSSLVTTVSLRQGHRATETSTHLPHVNHRLATLAQDERHQICQAQVTVNGLEIPDRGAHKNAAHQRENIPSSCIPDSSYTDGEEDIPSTAPVRKRQSNNALISNALQAHKRSRQPKSNVPTLTNARSEYAWMAVNSAAVMTGGAAAVKSTNLAVVTSRPPAQRFTTKCEVCTTCSTIRRLDCDDRYTPTVLAGVKTCQTCKQSDVECFNSTNARRGLALTQPDSHWPNRTPLQETDHDSRRGSQPEGQAMPKLVYDETLYGVDD
ncbi:hypothetical protein GLAREA_02456 [Glarea lozoyensis ATCC 20868]|uniref:Uncharacterized protein n=1 Tax=Glarea lozoyensis (strain ATCC 20868 / MF5171) TaxID=1116229 RepID=S3DJ16_GLAL2|nr:uncharacterized protein GLAREA_02456 [Glarea lozoyensis ATCC 20868]EPE26543.1 hypothetical protein GLAREA_02456 [Glarea lozoyensis ATCC 20868]